MTLRVLRAAVDTLEVSFSGEVLDEVAEALDQKKSMAFESPQAFLAGFHEMMVMGKAFAFWRWRLASPEFSIVMKKGGGPSGVTAQVRFSAWGLANRELSDLWFLARLTMEHLGSFKPLSVSRCDVCVDFQGWEPTPADLAGIVCPAAYRATHGTEKQVQTFQYGKGPMVLRIYDKTAELESSHKEWFRQVWALCEGYDPSLPVTRVEAQMRRQVLGELHIDCVEQVIENPGALLDYGLRWCQLRVPSGDATKSRWPEDPRWTHLREAVFGGTPLGRSPKVSSLMSLDRAKAQLIGLAATAGAYFGTTDYLKALQQLSFAAEVHMMDEKIDFAARVEEKRCRALSGDF